MVFQPVMAIFLSMAAAQVPTPLPRLDARAAQAVVAGCAAHAAGRGQSHAIAVVDAGGRLIAALRMDGNGFGILDFAIAKAQAAAAWGFSTAQMAEGARETPGFAAAPYVVTVAGGLPVFAADGRERLGAVGVSGEAPADGAACAEAGIAAAGLRAGRAPG
ncbi:MAG: glc operon protein GlcG [Sphingomonadales bacterium]|nr:glc operon protein GlcG [Sphingomonadales bacterium]